MHVHVIGAGLAGLSAAVALQEAGQTVTVLEAGPVAGGRCRSYFDRELGLRIDNGNHLLLSGNRSAFAYLDTIGARSTLVDAGRADVPVHGSQQWAALGAAAEPRPDSVVGAVAKAPHAGQPCHRSPCPAAAAPRERRCHGRHLAAQRHLLPSAARAARRRGAEHATRHRIGAAAGCRDARDIVPRRQRLHPGRSARGAVGEPGRSRGGMASGARLPDDHRPAGRRAADRRLAG